MARPAVATRLPCGGCRTVSGSFLRYMSSVARAQRWALAVGRGRSCCRHSRHQCRKRHRGAVRGRQRHARVYRIRHLHHSPHQSSNLARASSYRGRGPRPPRCSAVGIRPGSNPSRHRKPHRGQRECRTRAHRRIRDDRHADALDRAIALLESAEHDSGLLGDRGADFESIELHRAAAAKTPEGHVDYQPALDEPCRGAADAVGGNRRSCLMPSVQIRSASAESGRTAGQPLLARCP